MLRPSREHCLCLSGQSLASCVEGKLRESDQVACDEIVFGPGARGIEKFECDGRAEGQLIVVD